MWPSEPQPNATSWPAQGAGQWAFKAPSHSRGQLALAARQPAYTSILKAMDGPLNPSIQ